MKGRTLSLRLELTLINVAVLAVMCAILIATLLFAFNIITRASTTFPAQEIYKSGIQSDNSKQNSARSTFQTTSIVTLVCTISTGAAFIYHIVKRKLHPLEQLTEKVSHMDAESLQPVIEISSTTGDEVIKLTAAFNQMISRVNHAYVMQKCFSSNAAHELKTPLAVLQTRIEVFRMKSDRSIEEYASLVDILYDQTEKLSALVQDLLELTNDRLVQTDQEVRLKEIIEETAFELEDTAQAGKIALTVSGDDIAIYGSDQLIQRAFYNLMQNAINYNVPGGSVSVTIQKRNSTAVVHVTDTGIGIPDTAKPYIFEPFYQVDRSGNRKTGGNGLGLAITRQIIARHGGKIMVSDNSPQGVCFCVELPISASTLL